MQSVSGTLQCSENHVLIACTTRPNLFGLIFSQLSMLSGVNGYADSITFGKFYESLSPDLLTRQAMLCGFPSPTVWVFS